MRKSEKVLEEASKLARAKDGRKHMKQSRLTVAAQAVQQLVVITDTDYYLYAGAFDKPLPVELQAAAIAELKVAQQNIDKFIAKVSA